MSLEDRIRDILAMAKTSPSIELASLLEELESVVGPSEGGEVGGSNEETAEFQAMLETAAHPAAHSDARPPAPQSPDETQAFEPAAQSSQQSPATVRTFGDYELLHEIAQGGMGIVYRARQVSLDRVVALKLIRSGQLASDAEVERFYVEARAAAKFKHPGILPVYEVGEHNKQHFFTMELVDGGSLQDRLNDNILPPREAAEIILKVAQAVQHAHDHDVVHRDLKPDNILLDADGQPKVADFGLAKQINDDAGQTIDGAVIGTPSYMPPEQAAGETDRVGKRSDVYSLGAVLYCTLTGRPPFRAANPVETLKQVLEQDPTPPRALDKSIPNDLQTICLKCLRKDVNHRYQSAGELAADLARWLNHEPIQARPVKRLEKTWLWCKRRPVVAGLLALLVLIVVFGSWGFVERQNALYSRSLVDSLIKADVREVPALIDEVERYQRWTRRLLQERLQAAESPLEQRHLRLALLRFDTSHIDPLCDDLLTCDYHTLGLLRNELVPHKEVITGRLWTALREDDDPSSRFRAGLALADYAASDKQKWSDADTSFLVDQVVAHASEEQPLLRRYLLPIKTRLYDDFRRVLRKGAGRERREVGSAKALAEFAADDPALIADAIAGATPAQYEALYPVVASMPTDMRRPLLAIAKEQPLETLSPSEQVTLGKRRAGAAITMLRTGNRDEILDVLHVDRNPESLVQFVHRCRARGVTAVELMDCLQRTDELRRTKQGEARRIEDRAVYGLLLALGELPISDLPESRREKLVEQLVDWYATDPSAAIHGATGWLLREWGYVAETNKVDRTAVAYSPDREWFVRQVDKPHLFRNMTVEKVSALQEQFKDNPDAVTDLARIKKAVEENGGSIWMRSDGFIRPDEPPTSFFFTFVVFPAGDYTIGSPANEPDRHEDESLSTVRLSAPFAVLDREITRGEFENFDGRKLDIDALSPTEAHPIAAASWYGSVAFCRTLSLYAGFSEDEQCYAAIDSPSLADEPREIRVNYTQYPLNWKLDPKKPAFRLLTEAEWEIMSRAGTASMYHFGADLALLEKYVAFADRTGPKTHLPRSRRPNLHGVFDTHGNLGEWCHDWYLERRPATLEDPLGPPEGKARAIRGGSWDGDTITCRSASRVYGAPTASGGYTGFRIAVSIPVE